MANHSRWNLLHLDVIISVGYRVKSPRVVPNSAIWANKILKDHLVKGYTINEKRLQEQKRPIRTAQTDSELLGNRSGSAKPLNSDEATGLLKVITDYTYALDVLDKYDHQVLEIGSTTSKELFHITYEEANEGYKGLRINSEGVCFSGNEKDESFQGSLAAIIKHLAANTCTQA